jgi:hypothetical protein
MSQPGTKGHIRGSTSCLRREVVLLADCSDKLPTTRVAHLTWFIFLLVEKGLIRLVVLVADYPVSSPSYVGQTSGHHGSTSTRPVYRPHGSGTIGIQGLAKLSVAAGAI